VLGDAQDLAEGWMRIPLIVNAGSGIVNGDSADHEHAVGAERR
jgi:hypothetical protein